MNFEQSKLLDTLPKQFFANLVAKVNKKISEGVDVINLGQGNPDKPTPDYIVKSAQKWVADPQTHKWFQDWACRIAMGIDESRRHFPAS